MDPAYKEYLKSEGWKELRQQVLMKHKYKCVKCGKPAKEVHHKTYARIFSERISDMMALCEICHRKKHKWI